MSYNIINFKIKKLDNLRIPVSSLYKHERTDWHPKREDHEDGTVSFYSLEVEMHGVIEEGVFCVSEIDCSGEGSGTTMSWILEPALRDSTGVLISSCVWEGGDFINQLRVEDGKVEWVEIEI